jgi:ABC-type transport system involved in cytochrome bd biosynthesis fused ATPase/permease subunit
MSYLWRTLQHGILWAMPLLIGIICLALGVSLAVAWWSPAFVAALQVLLVVVLLLWGAISTLVGYSALKARREYDESIAQEPVSAAQPSSKTAPASEESAT